MSFPDGKFRNRLRHVIGTSIPTSFHVEETWICLRHVKHNFKSPPNKRATIPVPPPPPHARTQKELVDDHHQDAVRILLGHLW
jgi:hypothetical protein